MNVRNIFSAFYSIADTIAIPIPIIIERFSDLFLTVFHFRPEFLVLLLLCAVCVRIATLLWFSWALVLFLVRPYILRHSTTRAVPLLFISYFYSTQYQNQNKFSIFYVYCITIIIIIYSNHLFFGPKSS